MRRLALSSSGVLASLLLSGCIIPDSDIQLIEPLPKWCAEVVDPTTTNPPPGLQGDFLGNSTVVYCEGVSHPIGSVLEDGSEAEGLGNLPSGEYLATKRRLQQGAVRECLEVAVALGINPESVDCTTSLQDTLFKDGTKDAERTKGGGRTYLCSGGTVTAWDPSCAANDNLDGGCSVAVDADPVVCADDGASDSVIRGLCSLRCAELHDNLSVDSPTCGTAEFAAPVAFTGPTGRCRPAATDRSANFGGSIDWSDSFSGTLSCDLNSSCAALFDEEISSGVGGSGAQRVDPRAAEATEFVGHAPNIADKTGSVLKLDVPSLPDKEDDTEPVSGTATYSPTFCGEAVCPFYVGSFSLENFKAETGQEWNVRIRPTVVIRRKQVKNVQIDLTQPVIGAWRPATGEVAFAPDSVSYLIRFDVSGEGDGNGHKEGIYTNDRTFSGFFDESSGALSIDARVVVGDWRADLAAEFDAVAEPPFAELAFSDTAECNAISGLRLDSSQSLSFDPDGDIQWLDWTVDGVRAEVGTVLPLGSYELGLRATDSRLAAGSIIETTDVVDTTPPVVLCPSDATVECEQFGGTSRNSPLVAPFLSGGGLVDTCDPSPTLSSDEPGFFPVGDTVVTFTASDWEQNANSCSAEVSVQDSLPPALSCPADITVECTAAGGASASHPEIQQFLTAASSSDICDPGPVISDDAPAFFGLGTTDVEFTASDIYGNFSACSARVTVEDTTAPSINVAVSPETVWPPNHKMEQISAAVVASDVCDPNPTIALNGVSSSEPDNGNGDGNTSSDVAGVTVGSADYVFEVRRERSGGGGGRVYTATYTATDASQNSSAASAGVSVER